MLRGSTGKRRPVLQAQCLEALKQAAVDEELMLLVLDKVFRAGDRPGRRRGRRGSRLKAGTFRNSGGVSRLRGSVRGCLTHINTSRCVLG